MGYDLSLVVGPTTVDPELICALCRGLLDKPTEALCGHLFCGACVSKRASLPTAARCPHCGGVLMALGGRLNSQKTRGQQSDQSTTVSMSTALPDLNSTLTTETSTNRLDSVRERLARLRVRCRNGCQATFELGAFATHVAKECPSTLVRCPHPRCSTILPRGELPAHSTRCGRELVPCVGCGVRMPAAELWAHERRHRCLECLLRRGATSIVAKQDAETLEHARWLDRRRALTNSFVVRLEDSRRDACVREVRSLEHALRRSFTNLVRGVSGTGTAVGEQLAIERVAERAPEPLPRGFSLAAFRMSHEQPEKPWAFSLDFSRSTLPIAWPSPKLEPERTTPVDAGDARRFAKARRVPPMTNAPPASAENSERTTPEPFGALAEGRELYSCVRCRRLIDRSSERSGHECRWHRGPVRYTSSVCLACRRGLYAAGCIFGTHTLEPLV